MKSILIILFTTCILQAECLGQDRYKTTSGEVRFNASTPLEDIDALNKKVNAILDPSSGNFAVVMLITDFEFDKKLMQEHFNENYMESSRYPKATFSGSLKGLEQDFMNNLPLEFSIDGKLTIHGTTRPIRTTARLLKKNKALILKADFKLRPEDHGIKVPRIVFQKIAREVQIKVNLALMEQ
jgi:polyisoprenoid-binding protein YceI